ncbi:unnamed protein product [Effrenium voratum]|nr:unnamed protein product [Effrenium voratum]
MLPGVPPIMNEGLLPESAACLAADMRWLAYSIHGRKLGDFIIIEMVGNWGCVPNHGESCSNPGNPRFEPTFFLRHSCWQGCRWNWIGFFLIMGGAVLARAGPWDTEGKGHLSRICRRIPSQKPELGFHLKPSNALVL